MRQQRILRPRIKNRRRDQELLVQLLLPLLAKTRWGDDEDVAPPLSPILRDDDACLDGLSETDFIGEDRPLAYPRLSQFDDRLYPLGIASKESDTTCC